ncbi:MAG: transaldolase [Puniceicoccales bacterium]|jgi:transaldolase|nr:transaldolase [Puniceicoccales bacterium]
MYLLDHLRNVSTVVADTGDLGVVEKFRPRDATTNPSIVLRTVAENPHFLKNILTLYDGWGVEQILDRLVVEMGIEILKIIPGRVSTEVDAHLSFDATATANKARELVDLYRAKGIPRRSVLIKIAATWEGIQAAKILEGEGIHCNMTLVFSLEQAIACAEAGVTLISPFVGRILDWYQFNNPDILVDNFDPGVESVRKIFSYYKKWGYKTEIMAASFRNIDEITALAGCDLLTISPKLLEQLAQEEGVVEDKMSMLSEDISGKKLKLKESDFRLSLNENQMATEKLSEGIRFFCRDIRQLERLIAERL